MTANFGFLCRHFRLKIPPPPENYLKQHRYKIVEYAYLQVRNLDEFS
jgi:hypothetical protein